MKYKIFLLVMSFMAIQSKELYCMEEAEPEIKKDLITLVGSDGDELSILRELAMQSGTIRSFLEMPGSLEARTGRIEFREIPTTHLITIFKIQQAIMEKATKRPENIGGYITDSARLVVEIELVDKKTDVILDLLLLSNFLDLSLLKNALARLYIYRQPKEKGLILYEKLKERVVPELYDLIVKHGLMHNTGIRKELNVADYIAIYGQPKVEINILNKNQIDLSGKNITNLDGIELLENKNKIQVLNLLENKLFKIPRGAFPGFSNLEWLYLKNNQIYEISSEAFIGLTNLELLDLSDNQLSAIPTDDEFKWLSNLTTLNLSNNKLIAIPSFKWLVSLKNLTLENNWLIAIPEEAFKELTNLIWLDLSFNYLSSFPPAIVLKDLKNLKLLDLENNQLSEIIQKAIRLYCKKRDIEVKLWGQFSRERKSVLKAIRELLTGED